MVPEREKKGTSIVYGMVAVAVTSRVTKVGSERGGQAALERLTVMPSPALVSAGPPNASERAPSRAAARDLNSLVVVLPELDDAEQQHHEDRRDQDELDEDDASVVVLVG